MKPISKFLLFSTLVAPIMSACSDDPNNEGSKDDPEYIVHSQLTGPHDVKYRGSEISLSGNVAMLREDANTPASAPFDAHVSDYGQLREVTGNNALTMDSIAVYGPIDAKDIDFIRECAVSGRLKSVNLANATVAGNKIPDGAFLTVETRNGSYTEAYFMPIYHIVLPDGITELGEGAFANLLLTEITLPSSVRTIGRCCFEDNRLLSGEINIPAGVNELPDHCFCTNSRSITKITIPGSVKRIGESAFADTGANEIVLGEGVERIEDSAFKYGKCESLRLPASLKYMGASSFGGLLSLKTLYCAAKKPPFAGRKHGDFRPDFTAFESTEIPEVDGGYYDTPLDVTVYVPTGSKARYMAAEGWDYFTKYFETDNIPLL